MYSLGSLSNGNHRLPDVVGVLVYRCVGDCNSKCALHNYEYLSQNVGAWVVGSGWSGAGVLGFECW